MKTSFSISELAREFDITPRAIRFYESEGMISPARQGQTRIFSGRDRARLGLIVQGKRVGFSLAEIRVVLDLQNLVQDETVIAQRRLVGGHISLPARRVGRGAFVRMGTL